MLWKFIRYLKGYLRIRVSGNAVERFINACSYKGIGLWNLSSEQACYEMNISIRDFKKLKPVIRKTRTKVVIVERTGFPFFLQKYHHRKLFFSGFFFCLLVIYILTTFIWDIKITGNMKYTSENLLNYLNEMDIREGMKRKNVDCTAIAREIRRSYDNIIWVSASIEGTNLIVNVKENDGSSQLPESVDTGTEIPYDIIADFSCQITKIITRNGISDIKEGDYIKKGDLLVSGQIPILNDAKEIIDYQYCVANADIIGKITYPYSDEIERSYYEKEYLSIEKQRYFLCIGKHRFQLGDEGNDYEHFTDYTLQKNFKEISFGIRKIAPYERIKKSYTDEQLQIILTENFEYYCSELEKKGVVILQNDVKIYTWSDKAKATGNLTVEMPVGQIKKSEKIETGDYIDGNDGNYN